MDIWAHSRTTDLLNGHKYNILKENYRFRYYRYCNLQNMQNVITGCWIIHFDEVQLSNTKGKSVLCNCRWTCWTTCWQPAQFSRIGRFLLNLIGIDSSGLLTTWTAIMAAGSVPIQTQNQNDSSELLPTLMLTVFDCMATSLHPPIKLSTVFSF